MALTLEPKKPPVEKKCALAKLRDSLNEDDQAILDKWLEDKVVPYRIFMALRQEGHTIGRQTVYEHSKGWCCCGPK
ncbi:hypothetical protein UFOVP1264_60 [uncultured Caudovirales phage]|uniref:Uncharacterized protein n=1 Tax=uncultured Caudovirales phage TaxID=2100421 RepID=A0A6J5RQI9_9CAUD|nr:hypothetical protein UFOVP1264_60 [uncultured Caudovirales phage]